ncbi:MAG: PH domain-containing protein [Oscillospiraceae bacterium]
MEYDSRKIVVTKGIFLIRTAVVPLCSIVRITVRRSLFLRVFRAKEIEVFCNFGSVKFFLGRDEFFPLSGKFPENTEFTESAKFSEEVIGAFSDTHALGGVFLFAAALTRVSRLFGGEYSERVSVFLEKILSDTVNNVSGFLQSVQIFIPRAAVAAAVFALAGWAFAFSKKLLNLMRFHAAFVGETAFVKSGVLTLYEHTLFLNSAAAVYEESVMSLLLGRAPVRVRGVILFPAVGRGKIGIVGRHSVGSPLRSFRGHCGVPLVIAAAAGAGLVCVLVFPRLRSAELLETALLCILVASLYSAAMRLIFIRRIGVSPNGENTAVTARKWLRLRSAVLPHNRIVCIVRRRNLFNKSRGNVEFFTRERLRFKVRQIPLD